MGKIVRYFLLASALCLLIVSAPFVSAQGHVGSIRGNSQHQMVNNGYGRFGHKRHHRHHRHYRHHGGQVHVGANIHIKL